MSSSSMSSTSLLLSSIEERQNCVTGGDHFGEVQEPDLHVEDQQVQQQHRDGRACEEAAGLRTEHHDGQQEVVHVRHVEDTERPGQRELQSEDRVEAAQGRVQLVVASAEKHSEEADDAHAESRGVQDEGDSVLDEPRLPCACPQSKTRAAATAAGRRRATC